ncbi:type II secretion system protein [Candidatus Uhrbacteria bacterium]|nr:type II secretion system protein [Candidatus Uhrbacteria bacterium]
MSNSMQKLSACTRWYQKWFTRRLCAARVSRSSYFLRLRSLVSPVYRVSAPKGFTLMELVVAIGVFAATMGFTMDLFVMAMRQQARVAIASAVQSDARLIFEMIAGALREGTIAYERAPTAEEVAIRSSDGSMLVFRRSVTECPESVAACVQIGRLNAAGTLVWAPLTSAGVTADAFDVLVRPTDDPFAWDSALRRYRSHVQPRVTMHLRLSAPTGHAAERVHVEGQTTFTSRVYQR